jgi:iron complex outermembrane receptor protein
MPRIVVAAFVTSLAAVAAEESGAGAPFPAGSPGPGGAAAAPLPPAPGPDQLLTVSASRSDAALADLPQSVAVIDREQLDIQLAASRNLGEALGKLIPGLAASNQSASTYGQPLRGRNLVVLIDGIPQSTSRNGMRDFWLVDPIAIERIEVLSGPTAIYGEGATGGLVNVVTRSAPDHGSEALSRVSLDGPLTGDAADGIGGSVGQLFLGTIGDSGFDYVVGGSYRRVGAFFDAEGDRIPPDPHGQGGFSESHTVQGMGKLGYKIGDFQRIQLSTLLYRSWQDTEYTTDPTVGGTFPDRKSRAIHGLDIDQPQQTDNAQVSLDYHHRDMFGSQVHLQAFVRDYETYFAPFDARALAAWGNDIVQSYIDSRKEGLRAEAATPIGHSGVRTTWGADIIREQTSQKVNIFDPAAYDASGGLVFDTIGEDVFVPEMDQVHLAPFAQLEVPLGTRWVVRGGVRYEHVDVEVDDFDTLGGNAIDGGTLEYRETMFNVGLVFHPIDDIDLYANYAQGFSLADIGRYLRTAPAGTSVETIDPDAQRVDSYEIGSRFRSEPMDGSLALFYNESDLGTTLDPSTQGIVRAPERIYGIETSLDVRPVEQWQVGGTFGWTEGKYDPDGDGDYEYLPGYRIAPLKATAYIAHATTARWRTRLQALYSGERNRSDRNAFGYHDVDDFVIFDLISQYDIHPGTITLAIENLFNELYYPPASQWWGANTSHSAGRGASASVTYEVTW